MIRKIALVISLSCWFAPLAAQQWVERKGEWYGCFSQDFRTYSKTYDFDGNGKPSPTIDHYISRLQGEYAINSFLSAGILVPFVHNTIYKNTAFGITSNETVNKPGDLELSLNCLLNINEDVSFAAFYRQSFATSETDAVYGLNTGFGDNAQQIGLSTRFERLERFYAFLDLGYKLRHKGFGDEINAHAELGIRLISKFWMIGRSQGVSPLENGIDDTQGGNFGLYQQYEGYWNTGIGGRYGINKWDFTALLSGNFKGQYSPESAIFTLELRYRFQKRDSDSD